VWRPAPGTTWQWQITERVDETVPAQMFDVDLFDARDGEINAGVIGRLHAKGAVVVCYMDSGAWESYRPDASKFPRVCDRELDGVVWRALARHPAAVLAADRADHRGEDEARRLARL
jgi:hypothetical protein